MSTLSIAPKKLSFAGDPMLIEVESGASPTAQNVTCSVSIYTDQGFYIARINPPYSASGKMITDISELFGFEPPIPSVLFAGSTTHSKAYGKYQLFHSDRTGTPPVNGAVGSSDVFTVIRGSSYNQNGFGSGDRSWYFLHSYYVQDHKSQNPVVKVVSPSQPEVYYFYSEAGATINYTATLQSINGTGDVVTGSFSIPTGLSSRYLSLEQLGSSLTDVVSYKISFDGTHIVHYHVDRHVNDYERFVLIENGCGGMEFIRFAGRHSRSHSVSRQTSLQPKWSGYNHSKGQYSTLNVEGGEVLELNTGYYSRSYIQHLEQILYSDAWVVDPVRRKFVKYQVVDNSIRIISDQDNKYNLTVSLSPAHIKKSANTFGQ